MNLDTRICSICGLPFSQTSFGGYFICPACDCGMHRNGTKWTYEEAMNYDVLKENAKKLHIK